jgi:ATP adenylyltransferase
MDRLYSPWRYGYVTKTSQSPDGCVFCGAAAADPLVVARGTAAFVILNLYPYNSGHLMVVPVRHVASLAELSSEELRELMLLVQRAEMAITEVYGPQGINVGLNLGRAAGAGIADHLHVHLVPRWVGDTNFMSVVGETRVLPEEVPASAERLRPVFERLSGDAGGRG